MFFSDKRSSIANRLIHFSPTHCKSFNPLLAHSVLLLILAGRATVDHTTSEKLPLTASQGRDAQKEKKRNKPSPTRRRSPHRIGRGSTRVLAFLSGSDIPRERVITMQIDSPVRGGGAQMAAASWRPPFNRVSFRSLRARSRPGFK